MEQTKTNVCGHNESPSHSRFTFYVSRFAYLLSFAWFGIGMLAPCAQAQPNSSWASAAIVPGNKATDLERLAAREVQRYLCRISGVLLPVTDENAAQGQPQRPLILVGTPESNALISDLAAQGRLKIRPEIVSDQSFVVQRVDTESRPVLVLTAESPVGVLYGAYTFLEHMGMGFYLGGDAFPGHNRPLDIPADLDIQQKPVFAIRGTLPWYNFLNSPTTWNLDDFKYFFDQMSKMKNNFVGFHTYDSEPFAPYEEKGQLVRAAPLATSKNYGWGALRGLLTEEFGFGTGDYFDQKEFGSRATTESQDRADAIRRAQSLLANALKYAKDRGLKVCVGFEVAGDPTQVPERLALEARLRELVCAYPMLDYVWLWQSESLGLKGADPPAIDSPLATLVQKQRHHFEYLKDPRRIVEAVRMSEYIQLGHALLKRLAPNVRLIVSGWGGDKWMRFSDFYQGLDETAPPDVIFAALDNIDPAAEPNVSAVYGKLKPQRERWPIPWYESDGGGTRRDQFCPQPNTREFTFLCRDAQAKGCQGLLAIHWRTRDVEEVAAYTAQFAWEPALTYEEFYRRFAAKCFGKEYAEEMSGILRQLESLGPRWTGGGGQSECGRFTWVRGNQLPKEENLNTLKKIRTRLTQIRKDMESKGRQTALERLNHLIATIDWVMLYDAAACKLYPDGLVPGLIAESEALKRAGKTEEAARKAQEAWEALKSCGLREAMRTFATKMTTRGEFGALATINVKAYASYLELQERIWALLPGPPPAAPEVTLEHPLHIVVKTPPSLFPERQPIPVRAVVNGPNPIAEATLRFRKLGDKDFKSASMKPVFRKTYEAVVPPDAVTEDGIEFYVEAKDAAGEIAFAPQGAPVLTYSACVGRYPNPSIFITQCERLPREGQEYDIQAAILGLPPGAKVRLRYRPVGTGPFKSIPMRNLFYDSFAATVPAEDVTAEGVEYFVEVEGEWFKKWTAPPGGENAPRRDVPDVQMPSPVLGLKAEVTAPYEVTLRWPESKDDRSLVSYTLYRSTARIFPLTPETIFSQTFKNYEYDVDVRAGDTYWYVVRARDSAGNLSLAMESVPVTIPKYAPPLAPTNVKATPGPGKVRLAWDAMDLPVVGYKVYRADSGGQPILLNEKTLIRQPLYVDGGLKEGTSYTYAIRAVDRGGQEGEPSSPVSVQPLARKETPVFVAHLDGAPDAEPAMKGSLAGRAAFAPGVVGQALDLTSGGWVTFKHNDVFDVSGEMTLEAWVKFVSIEGMPVFLSHGEWRQRGFFVQVIGGRVRFSIGGDNVCDAGRIEPNRWYYIVCVYDMKTMRVYVNGREAGHREVSEVDYTPWVGPFYIGRYTLDGKPYEVNGLIDEVKIYHRARTAEEIRKEYEALAGGVK